MTEHLHTIPARILKPTPGQVRQLADVDLPEGVQPFFWSAEISNNNLDFYFGHMAESTLRNFANDASAGVSFLDSHNSRSLGYGQSVSGTFEATGDYMRTVAEFYTVPGIGFGGGVTYASTDDFIMSLRAGLARDVSVGFYGGQEICDICGEDVWAIDWDNWRFACPHIPGVEYAIGEQGDQVVVATFEVQDAHLAETSAVYDGATPGAEMLSKAERLVETGEMSALQVSRFEKRYRIKLATPPKQWVVDYGKGQLMKPKNNRDTEQSEVEEPVVIEVTEEIIEEVIEETEEETTPPEVEAAAEEARQIRAILKETDAVGQTTVDRVRWLIAENARLATLADQGRQYREDLVEEALKEGVRSVGKGFPVETYRSMFSNASLETIKELRDSWRGQSRIPGSRVTTDTPEKQTKPEATTEAPREAYKS